MPTLLWWNLHDFHDDRFDPTIIDIVKPTRIYRRDLREVAMIIDRVRPIADVVGCGEVENQGVLRDLGQEIARAPAGVRYICDHYVNSRDPRGIDVGALWRSAGSVRVERFTGLWPAEEGAVRPIIVAEAAVGPAALPLMIAFVHGKSRRSGATTPDDAMPGSRIRFAYGQAVRDLALDCGQRGVPLVVMGDFNDEPESHSLRIGAGAESGRPRAGIVDPGRLYNLSRETGADSPGTAKYNGAWLCFDQVLVNGVLLAPPVGGLCVHGRPRILADPPLIFRGGPNRWYSDHLPVLLTLGFQAPLR